MTRRLPPTLALLIPLVVSAPAEPGDDAGAERLHRDNILVCGPRCVQHVFDLYGRELELRDVIRQIGKPLGEGTSLADLAKCLRANGVGVQLIEIGPQATIDWPHPAIVHLKPGSDASAMGHFVVWENPASGGPLRMWNGIEAPLEFDRDGFSAARSGAMLLTSPDSALAVITTRPVDGSYRAWLTINLFLFVVVLGLAFRLRRPVRRADGKAQPQPAPQT